jgi:microcin C transport system permease protein
MSAYFIRRFLLIIPTFLGVTIIVFTITRLVPGGPLERQIMQFRMAAASGESGNTGGGNVIDPTSTIPKGALEEMKKAFDLDKPGYVAYFLWLKKVVKLDLGKSYSTREPVWDMIKQRFPISIMFGLTGFVLAYLLSVPLGILKALKHGSHFDFASSAIVFLGYSIPGWALGALLLVFFASGRFYDVLPLGDIKTGSYQDLPEIVKSNDSEEDVSDDFGQFEWEKLSFLSKVIDTSYHMFLPVLCYTIGSFATLTMLMKNSLMENMGRDYIRTAFAKGLSPYRVVLIHALRNSLIPLATGLGHAISIIMAGSYLIESVFNIDGLGYLGYTSIISRDYTVVMGILTVNTILTLLGNILSDVLYALIDPRIRFE